MPPKTRSQGGRSAKGSQAGDDPANSQAGESPRKRGNRGQDSNRSRVSKSKTTAAGTTGQAEDDFTGAERRGGNRPLRPAAPGLAPGKDVGLPDVEKTPLYLYGDKMVQQSQVAGSGRAASGFESLTRPDQLASGEAPSQKGGKTTSHTSRAQSQKPATGSQPSGLLDETQLSGRKEGAKQIYYGSPEPVTYPKLPSAHSPSHASSSKPAGQPKTTYNFKNRPTSPSDDEDSDEPSPPPDNDQDEDSEAEDDDDDDRKDEDKDKDDSDEEEEEEEDDDQPRYNPHFSQAINAMFEASRAKMAAASRRPTLPSIRRPVQRYASASLAAARSSFLRILNTLNDLMYRLSLRASSATSHAQRSLFAADGLLAQVFWTAMKYLLFFAVLAAVIGLVALLGFGLYHLGVFLLAAIQLVGHKTGSITLSSPSLPKIWPSGFSLPQIRVPSLRLPSLNLPGLAIPDDVVRDIYNRLNNLDEQVYSLQKESRLRSSTIERLKQILPTQIAGGRGTNGDFEFPPEFWSALKSKVSLGFGSDPTPEVTSDWDLFLQRNRMRLGAFVDERARFVSNEVVASQSQVLQQLEATYSRLHDDISLRANEIEKKYRTIDQTVSRTAASVASSVARTMGGVWQKNIPAAQLDALSQASQRAASSNINRVIDFLSIGQGAVVNPWLTSLTSSRKRTWIGWPINFFNRLVRIEEQPPHSTQRSWHDTGECWCTRMDNPAYSPQIVYRLGYEIFPTQFTIEHVPSTATMRPGLAPRYVELWAEVKDATKHDQIAYTVDKLLGDDVRSNEKAAMWGEHLDLSGRPYWNNYDPVTWVRIGRAKYDLYSSNNIQTFGLLVDLKKLDVAVQDVSLRFIDTWGETRDVCLYRVRLHGISSAGVSMLRDPDEKDAPSKRAKKTNWRGKPEMDPDSMDQDEILS